MCWAIETVQQSFVIQIVHVQSEIYLVAFYTTKVALTANLAAKGHLHALEVIANLQH